MALGHPKLKGWGAQMKTLKEEMIKLGYNPKDKDISSHHPEVTGSKITIDGEQYNLQTEDGSIILKEPVENATIGVTYITNTADRKNVTVWAKSNGSCTSDAIDLGTKYINSEKPTIESWKEIEYYTLPYRGTTAKNTIDGEQYTLKTVDKQVYAGLNDETFVNVPAALINSEMVDYDKNSEKSTVESWVEFVRKEFFVEFFEFLEESSKQIKCKHETLPELDIQTGKYHQRCIKCKKVVE